MAATWNFETSSELDSLNAQIGHYHDGYAKIFLSTHSSTIKECDISAFVIACLQDTQAANQDEWNAKPRPWQTLTADLAHRLLSQTLAQDGIDDQEYRTITDQERAQLIDAFFWFV